MSFIMSLLILANGLYIQVVKYIHVALIKREMCQFFVVIIQLLT